MLLINGRFLQPENNRLLKSRNKTSDIQSSIKSKESQFDMPLQRQHFFYNKKKAKL